MAPKQNKKQESNTEALVRIILEEGGDYRMACCMDKRDWRNAAIAAGVPVPDAKARQAVLLTLLPLRGST